MAGLALVLAAAVGLEIGVPEKISQFLGGPFPRQKQYSDLGTTGRHQKRGQLGSVGQVSARVLVQCPCKNSPLTVLLSVLSCGSGNLGIQSSRVAAKRAA